MEQVGLLRATTRSTRELEEELEREIHHAKGLLENIRPGEVPDFDIRGALYALAGEIAPHARENELDVMRRWLDPQPGEVGVDVAAGAGFLTLAVARWTRSRMYAVDTSALQLKTLMKHAGDLSVITVTGSLADETTLQAFEGDVGCIDFVTSLGGIHHVLDSQGNRGGPLRNDQRVMFQNVGRLLRPGGRFVAADVSGETVLAKHFERSVKEMCLTGHCEKWLTPERLTGELIDGTDLELVKADVMPVGMTFDSRYQMGLFMKGFHAYDVPNGTIVADLEQTLGVEERDGKIHLNWPLLLFHARKRGG